MTDAVAELAAGGAGIASLAAAGGAVAALAAAGYRWYARERIPDGLALLLSLGVVAITLNTADALEQALGGQRGVFTLTRALVNVLTFVVAGAVAPVAARLGDHAVTSLAAATGADVVDGDVGRVVRSVGRVLTVELPEVEDVGDMDAYDPVPADHKEAFGGKTLVFPRRLTVEELHARVVDRLKDDYGVGHVDLELSADGSVEYLAVGSRAAGLGPTLPPRTVALAVRADPAFSAGPGDVVQVWRAGDPPERVTTAELRATAGDVATLAVDETDAEALAERAQYRLVTLPSSPRAAHEFAGLLRSADETMAAVEVAAGGGLAGRRVADLAADVVAVRTPDGDVEALPAADRSLAAGEVVYAVARPEVLRELERTAAEADPAEA